MAKKIVTLYVDDTSIRLAVVRGKRVRKCAELSLDLGVANINPDIKEAEIATKVKQLFKSQKVRTKKVILGISGMHCLSRPIILPQLPRTMLDEAVMREARRVLPVPPEQLYISWQIIPAPPEKAQVFLVAVPRQTADFLLKALHKAGLKPHLMDLKPIALARVVKETTAIIIDVQTTEFDIVIMSDKILQPVRTVAFPSEATSPDERLQMVRNELGRTIEFFNANNLEKTITPAVPIYVAGELADEPELGKSLAKELGYRVLPLLPPLRCPEHINPTRYTANIGLALKEMTKDSGPLVANLNTLPAPYRSKPLPLAKIAIVPGTAVIVGLLVLMTMNIQAASASIASMRSQLDNTNSILTQRQAQKKELNDNIATLQKKIAEAEASRQAFIAVNQNLRQQGNATNGDLQETTRSLLSLVTLTRISHTSGKQLIIQASAPSEVEILAYARNLDASGRFSEVTITNVSRTDEQTQIDSQLVEKMNFLLTLKIKARS